MTDQRAPLQGDECQCSDCAEANAGGALCQPREDGEYAIVEVLGHRTLIGRIAEVERFGSKLMSIEPVFDGRFLPPVLIGGGSIYQFTSCTRETAFARAPKHDWQLPVSLRAVLPTPTLAGPSFACDDELTF